MFYQCTYFLRRKKHLFWDFSKLLLAVLLPISPIPCDVSRSSGSTASLLVLTTTNVHHVLPLCIPRPFPIKVKDTLDLILDERCVLCISVHHKNVFQSLYWTKVTSSLVEMSMSLKTYRKGHFNFPILGQLLNSEEEKCDFKQVLK